MNEVVSLSWAIYIIGCGGPKGSIHLKISPKKQHGIRAVVLLAGGERKGRLVLVVAGGDSVVCDRALRTPGQTSGVLRATVEVRSRRRACVQRVCSGCGGEESNCLWLVVQGRSKEKQGSCGCSEQRWLLLAVCTSRGHASRGHRGKNWGFGGGGRLCMCSQEKSPEGSRRRSRQKVQLGVGCT
jgi:hypothetical protein